VTRPEGARPLLVCALADPSPKSDMGSMAHPFFALRAPDTRARHYERNGNTLDVIPGPRGLATVHDKDVLIYCVSQLVAALERGTEPTRTVRVTAHALLRATGRPTSGVGYRRLREAFDRLTGTRYRTNIASGGRRVRAWFGLLDEVVVRERRAGALGAVAIDITLSRWLFDAVLAREVLTLSRRYFALRGPLERSLYLIARKHCGAQRRWSIGLALLHAKTGARVALREFRRQVRGIARRDPLPDYALRYAERTDRVVFVARPVDNGSVPVGGAVD